MSCDSASPLHAPVRLGVCAMRKKIQAKPMQEILQRLACEFLEIVIIDDEYWERPSKVRLA